jgi:hypothetical protein
VKAAGRLRGESQILNESYRVSSQMSTKSSVTRPCVFSFHPKAQNIVLLSSKVVTQLCLSSSFWL